MKAMRFALALWIAAPAALSSFAADPLDTWIASNPSPAPNDLRAVTTGNGLVVAVGTAGTIVTSSDRGEIWTLQDSGITNVNHDLVAVAYGNGQFVALPSAGSQLPILTSVDGTNWVASTNLFLDPTFFTGLAFGGGTFVAVGYGTLPGDFASTSSGSRFPQAQTYSTPGTQGAMHINYNFYSLSDQMTIFYNGTNIFDSGYISGSGQFNVNFGPGPSNSVTVIMNQFTNPSASTLWDYSLSIAGSGGGIASTNILLTSTDGMSWTRRTGGVSDPLNAVTYAQGQFAAVGGTASPTNRGHIVTSTDGVTWTLRRTNVPALYAAVAGNSSGFVAVAGRRTSRSANGVTWTDSTDTGIGFAGRNAVAAGTNVFVAADTLNGLNDFSVFGNSTDSAAWTTNGTFESVSALTFANGRFYAVGTANRPGVSPLGTRPALLFSDDGISWKRRSGGLKLGVNGSKAPSISATAFGNGRFVVLPRANLFNPAFVSTNGSDWDGNPYGYVLPGTAAGAVFANGQFVAVGGDASVNNTFIATSAEGTNWTTRYNFSVGSLSAVAFGNGVHVVVGGRASGERPVLTSTDAVSWTLQTPGIVNDLFGIAFGGGNFVAVGAAGTVARSANGSSWTTQSITSSNHLRGVVFAGGQFVAVGDRGSIFTSPTGTGWTRRTSGTTLDLNVVTFFNGRYLAGGDAGKLLTSLDGITWSAADSGTDLSILGAATGTNRVLLVGESSLLTTSTNGLNWVVRDLLPPGDALFREVLGVDDRILALGSGQGVSTSGRSWAGIQNGGQVAGNGAVYTNGLVVAVGTDLLGQETIISVSSDRGDSWITTNLGTLGQLYGIVHANGKFVAVGTPGAGNAVILTSTNGFNWTPRNSGTNTSLWDIAYGNGTFVAVGASGGVKSTDGITWTPAPGAKGETIAFGGGKFVIAGSGASYSTDGTVWTGALTNAVTLENVRHGFGTFVAAGPSGIYTSSNGINWQSRFIRTQQKLNAVEFVNDSFFVVGFSGTIFQSGYLTNTPATILQSPQSTTVLDGATATFNVSATGRLPMSFQWFKNGVAIPGATAGTLTIPGAGAADMGSYHVVVNNEFGLQTSLSATLTIAYVSVVVQPDPLFAFTNTSATFTSVVTGGTPTGYRWRNNSFFIPGATNSTLTFTNVQTSNGLGYYFVDVTFPFGEVSSQGASFVVITSVDQVYLSLDPGYQAIPIGDTASITSLVYGPLPLSYQWRKDNVPLAGATNATLVVTNAQLTNSGDYTFTATYPLGTVTNTPPATLLVYYAEPPILSSGGFISPNFFRVIFTGLTNRSYEISFATNLNHPIDWQTYDYANLITNPLPYDVNVLNLPPSAQHFFRVKILPP